MSKIISSAYLYPTNMRFFTQANSKGVNADLGDHVGLQGLPVLRVSA